MKKIAIIGAGITGLCAGIFALKKGYQVSIYEKNSFAGGCCTGWVKDGYYIDNCMHWLTGTNHSTKTFKLWKKVGALSENSSMYQGEYFYKSIYNNESIELSKDIDKFKSDMLKLSKEDEFEINRLINTIKGIIKANKEQHLFDFIFVNPISFIKLYFRYRHLTLEDLANKFKHPLLKKMITDYLPKEYSSLALIYAYATFASGNGKVYAKGSKAFANNIFNQFLKLGGFIHFNSEITNIYVYKNRINNIEINNKEIVVADEYIYTADPFHLFNKLIDSSYLPLELHNRFLKKDEGLIPSSFHIAYLVDKNTDILDTVIFDIPKIKVGLKEVNRLMIKDYSYLYPNSNKSIIEVFIIQNSVDFDFWKNLHKDEKSYEKLKNELTLKIKEAIINKYPTFKSSIKMLDCWTPFTYYNYYNSYCGSYMGTIFNKDSSFKDISYKIKGLNNFFLATYWQKLTGGLPVSLKIGYEVSKLL